MAQNWEMAVEFRNLSSGSLFSRAWNSSVGQDTELSSGGVRQTLGGAALAIPCLRKEASHLLSQVLLHISFSTALFGK